MKKLANLLILLTLMAGCTGQSSPGAGVDRISPSPQIEAAKSCGDGVCDGPENAQTCPEDCQENPSPVPADEISPRSKSPAPPLQFFYVIHTHTSDQFQPYADPGETTIDTESAENMLAAIEGIAAVLDKYGVKASWQFLPATIKGFHQYQGEDNIITQLLAHGHEIGVHTHKLDDIQFSVQNLQQYTGIDPQVTSGFLAQLSSINPGESKAAMSLAIDYQAKQGLSVGTVNLSPGGEMNPLATECQDELGEGNDMWLETGNLMFPWRPDYAHQDPCSHNPEGDMLLIDHVSINWVILPGEGTAADVLDNRHFARLEEKFDAALDYLAENEPERTAVWGFVTHIIEYAPGGKAEYPPTQDALQALDDFLSYVDSKQDLGLVVYSTPAQIAEQVKQEGY